jgi:HD-GYP domain-containing protein (c-di-GMP phosphodiesterase class II)
MTGEPTAPRNGKSHGASQTNSGEVEQPLFSMLNLVMAVSDAIDLVSPRLVDHHKRVAYVAHRIAEKAGLPVEDRSHILWAGLLHDSGALSLKQRVDFLEFELFHPGNHAEFGCRLVEVFEPFKEAAFLIKHHHARWDDGAGQESHGEAVPLGGHILHLADRVAIMTGGRKSVLARSRSIVERVLDQSGKMFEPQVVEVFEALASTHSFWLDITSPWLDRVLYGAAGEMECRVDWSGLVNLGRLFARLIDFRSRWTAAHSTGVAATAACLGSVLGLTEQKCSMLNIAGYVHDLGKLTVPVELLEKPQRFSPDDFAVMMSHPYYTHSILENLPELDDVNRWASFHHERLDGSGYPFCLSGPDLPVEARIISVSDVFTALSEDRPLRLGMSKTARIRILTDMAANNLLDGDVVSALAKEFEWVDTCRGKAQEESSKEYNVFESVTD